MCIPRVSIIIPVRNEAVRIAACLESVFAMEGTDDAEVLVIDGMSSDGTREILDGFMAKHSAMIVLDNPAQRVTNAVNIGVAGAKAPLVARLDAHALYAPDYLAACLRVLEKTGAGNVGGHAFAVPGANSTTARAIALAHHSPLGLGGASFRNVAYSGEVETVWPGCFKKEALNKAGPLCEELTRSEDIELNYRIRKAGYTIICSSEIKAWYLCRPTLCTLWKQRWQDGFGVMQTLHVNAGALRARHFVPFVVVTLSLSVALWAIASLVLKNTAGLNAAMTTVCSGAVVYSALLVLFSISALTIIKKINRGFPESLKEERKITASAVLVLPFVFMTLHFSYGLGSLAALVGFLIPRTLFPGPLSYRRRGEKSKSIKCAE